MPDIHLYSGDSVRVSTGNRNQGCFADITGEKDEAGIGVMFYDMHIFQIRKKRNSVKVFVFASEELMKEFDFRWWSDAEVIYEQLTQ